MTICRRHPALGWLALQGNDTKRTLEKLIAFRDEALSADAQHSGMPPGFVDWSLTVQLPSMLHVPFYRKQVEARIEQLRQKSERISDDINRLVGSMIEEQGEADAERHQLAEMLQGKS